MDSWDEVAAALREMRGRAGSPSFSELESRVAALRARHGRPEHASRTAIYDCFGDGRVRMDLSLLEDLGTVLGLTGKAAREWSETCFAVQNRLGAAQIVTADPAPRRVDLFVGRAAERAAVEAGGDGRVLITGMGGIGKTQLAVHIAGDRLRDGRAHRMLLICLRAYDESRPAADPDAVRHELLRTLGVDHGVRRRPVEEQQRRLAAALIEERCVLILDDVASAGQVATVLGEADLRSLVLVTSRVLLTALPGTTIELGPLDADAAVRMLPGSVGPVTGELTTLLGCHPLALELTARRLSEHPDWPPTEHLAAIRRQHDLLHLPEPVAASLELSLRSLDPHAGRALRLIAEQPCARLPEDAVLSLIDDDGDDGDPGASVTALVSASLLGGGPDGLEIHDLVRVAARAWSLREDQPSARDQAGRRLLDHYLAETERAVAAIRMLPYVATGSAPAADSPEAERSWAWLVRERDNLLALADPARTGIRPEATLEVSRVLGRYLEAQGLYPAAVVLHRWAVGAAVRIGDRAGEVTARGFLAGALGRLGDSEEALAEADRVLELGDPRESAEAVATARNLRGIVAVQRGDLATALDEFRAALVVVDSGSTVRSRAGVLGNIGAALTYLGRIPEAIEHHRMALDQALADDDPTYATAALTNLVDGHLADGAPDLALESARQACDLADRYGTNLAPSRSNLGIALTALGRYDEARAAHLQGLEAARASGDPDVTAGVHNNLGDTEQAAGDWRAARVAYAAALETVAHADGLEAERARAGLAAVAEMRDR